jgi:hypothetical protein
VLESWAGRVPETADAARRRSDFGAGLSNPSDDGGREEFLGFWPSRPSSSATRSTSRAFASARTVFSVRNTLHISSE